jgi:ubiquinol-cytochrome c reductase iron-sulfur subunit
MAEGASAAHGSAGGETRRDFLYLTTGAMGVIATCAVAWPIIDTMNPSADVLALASTEVDLSPILEGQRVTVTWRGKPVFIDHRTAEQIETARDVQMDELPDPQTDAERVKDGKEKWLVLVGVCTHLGCVPLGQRSGEPRGEWGGWFCPCHGSHYDTSGRIRKGPAPVNLEVPPYEFISEEAVLIG